VSRPGEFDRLNFYGAVLALFVACTPPASPARLAALMGPVAVAHAGAEVPGQVGRDLFHGDLVTVGQDGAASIVFSGGNAIDLLPGASLLIGHGPADSPRIGAVLVQGAARATGRGVERLVIGTPFGMTDLGVGRTQVELDAREGVYVLAGVVVLTGDEERSLAAGHGITIDGLVLDLGTSVGALQAYADERKGGGMLRAEAVHVSGAGASILRGGSWMAAPAGDSLAAGEGVRAGSAFADLGFTDGSAAQLDPGGELAGVRAGPARTGYRAHYALGAGRLKLALLPGAVHLIEVGGELLHVLPGGGVAEVEVQHTSTGPSLEVALGRVRIAEQEVAAGHRYDSAGGVQPLGYGHVLLQIASDPEISFQGAAPPVTLDWRAQGEWPAARLEVAQDAQFAEPLWAEAVPGGRFMYGGFAAGRYHWRVRGDAGAPWLTGAFNLQPHQDKDCISCKRVNDIDDSGEATTVYYQRRLPAITLRWSAQDGLQRYRVQVYADGDFDRALVEKVVAATRLHLTAGQLGEGKYYWLVTSLDAAGSPRKVGSTNTLTIAYDNQVQDLRILSVRAGGRASVTAGEVARDATLFINGERVQPRADGRFRHSVDPGQRWLVYRVIQGTKQRYYTREIPQARATSSR
jgi:hypothetical protein